MFVRLFAAGLLVLSLAGCASVPNPFAGAPPAGAASLPTHTPSHDPRVATLAAAGLQPLSGAAIGRYFDGEEAELRTQLQATGMSVTRAGDHIVLNLPAELAFDEGKSMVKPEFKATLVSLGVVLKHFNRTLIDVYGYSDAQARGGKELSQRRAVAVATMLAGQGVDQRRFYIEGRGAADPIAPNDDEAGRAQNRRIEIQLSPLF